MKVGGAGNKLVNIAEGKGELYYRSGKVSKWDLVGGEALLLSQGGRLYNLEGKELLYKNNGEHKIPCETLAFYDKNFLPKEEII